MTRKRIYEVPIDDADAGDRDPEGEAGRSGDGPAAAPGPEAQPTAPADGDVAPASDAPADPLDHLQRLQAEFANYRRRTDRERGETMSWAQGALVERLLPVLDDFERAAAAVGDSTDPAVQGLQMVSEKLVRVLTEAGLERIRAEGEPFDPDQHEALMTQPVSAEMSGKVLAEIEPGYRFKGRLLRPVRVQVGVEEES